MNDLILNGRSLKLARPAALRLGAAWSAQFRVTGTSSFDERRAGPVRSSEIAFITGLYGATVDVAFKVEGLGVLLGQGCYEFTRLTTGDVTIELTGSRTLQQVSAWPAAVPLDKQVAHGVTIERLEREARDAVAGMCPPDVDVEIRRTQQVKGIRVGTLIIEMSVGGDPW